MGAGTPSEAGEAVLPSSPTFTRRFIKDERHLLYVKSCEVKTVSKKQPDVGDLIEMLVAIRNNIDEFVNKVGTAAMEPEKHQEPATEKARCSIAQFNAEEYNSLPFKKFETKKKQIWERMSCAENVGDKERFLRDLINCCTRDADGNEATIQTPMICYDYGYWLFRDWIYRRPMPKP